MAVAKQQFDKEIELFRERCYMLWIFWMWREESIVRYVAYRCSVILTATCTYIIHLWEQQRYLRSNLSKSGVSGTSITCTAFDPQRHYSTSWSGKITLLFPVSDTADPGIYSIGAKAGLLAPSRSQTPSLLSDHEIPAGEIIHVLFLSGVVIVGLESHFVFFEKCVSGSLWKHKEPG